MSKPDPEHIVLMRLHINEMFRRYNFALAEEYRFDPLRKWRFDFALWVQGKSLGVEIDGGIWTSGRHTRGRGYQADLDKLNAATAAGWQIFRFSVDDVLHARDIPLLRKWMEG
ncbi:MAG TPA: hypothetical protein VGT24_01630 [Candidatus Acidoferrales bacterium]|nr:hypothetical protein [Candidatus Acidoferrales bacterium]